MTGALFEIPPSPFGLLVPLTPRAVRRPRTRSGAPAPDRVLGTTPP
ncbi:hypothetical protein ACFXP1_18270 [Streptomyces sp. NPDC059112]